MYLDTDPNELVPAYLAEDAGWSGYQHLIWQDDSVAGDSDPPRTNAIQVATAGAAGTPLNRGTVMEDSSSSVSFLADEDPLHVSLQVTKTAEGMVVTSELSKVGEATPILTMTATDTNALDAVDSFDTFAIAFQGFLEAIISDPQITYSGGSSETWYGYPVLPTGDVDTGDWLGGFVNVTFDPWIYSYALAKYIYVGDGSGWVFVPQN
jgi:hypothetical protein